MVVGRPVRLNNGHKTEVRITDQTRSTTKVRLRHGHGILHTSIVRTFCDSSATRRELLLSHRSLRLTRHNLHMTRNHVGDNGSSPIRNAHTRIRLSRIHLSLEQTRQSRTDTCRQLTRIVNTPLPTFISINSPNQSVPAMPSSSLLLGHVNRATRLQLTGLRVSRQRTSLNLRGTRQVPSLAIDVKDRCSRHRHRQIGIIKLSVPVPLFGHGRNGMLTTTHHASRTHSLHGTDRLHLHARVRAALSR